MGKRRASAAIALAASAALIAACGGGSGSSDDDGPIVYGMETSLSGPDAAFGTANRDGANLAVKQANAEDPLDGRKFELQAEDDEARPEKAASICKKFSTSAAVVFTAFSYTSIPCTEVLEGKRPQITILATSHVLTEQGNKWLFRIAVPDTKLTSDVLKYVKEQGWKRVALTHVNDDFGNGAAESIQAAADDLGLEIVANETYTAGDREFSAQLGKVKDSNPDVHLNWGNYAEAAALAKQRGNFGLDSVPYIESDAVATPEYPKLTGDASVGTLYATHWSSTYDTPANAKFLKEFNAEYGHDPDLFATEAYTAGIVATEAIKKAGSTDPEEVRDALANTSMETPMGKISFDENGDPTYGTFLVEILGGGKEKVIVGR